MLEKLKKIFPSLIEEQSIPANLKQSYAWYKTADEKLVGIDKKQIGSTEKQLLELFLLPYQESQVHLTEREEKWRKLLFDQDLNNWSEAPEVYRFIYFSLSNELLEADSFREAINGIFPNLTPILWENNHEGIIIEEIKPALEDEIDYNNIIDVFMSDFYLDIHLYIGPYFSDLERASTYYEWTKTCFKTLHKYNKKAVINYVEAVPYFLIEGTSETDYSILTEAIFQETSQDEELLKTIQVFLECNSNTSLAAKKMYMHRNSLQYRIDKFIEKTGIDVKQFEGALSVYLTLLLKYKLKRS